MDTKTYQSEEVLEKLHGTIICEQPNTELYKFVGNLRLPRESGINEDRSLGADNILLRGSRLKNTAYIYGKYYSIVLWLAVIIFMVII